jgi:hypothetical protein
MIPQQPPARKEVQLLFARQLALQQGLNWERLTAKARERLLTFAGSLLATVERKAEVNWHQGDY